VEPLTDAAAEELVEPYAATLETLELTAGEPLLVLPNAEFFPDRFTGDAASVERLVARMQGYAGLEAVTIDVELAGEAPSNAASGCGTGGCGTGACATPEVTSSASRLERSPERWLMRVPAAELADPIVLTARVATSLGAVALAERGSEAAADTFGAELAAVALGFGVLLLEASYLYKKSCGGPSVSSATAFGCRELALLFALSVAREKQSLRAALGELGTTQRAVVKDAAVFVAECPTLVRRLRESPARVARGDYQLQDGGSLLSKLFGRRTRPRTNEERLDDALAALERGASLEEVERLVGPADGE